MFLDHNLIIGLILWLIILPVAGPIFLFCFLWKCISLAVAKFRYSKSKHIFKPLNFMDSFLHARENGGIIGCAIRLENNPMTSAKLDVQEFRNHFLTTFINNGNKEKYPYFYTRSVSVFGFMYAVANLEQNIDLNHHIREMPVLEDESENAGLRRIMSDNSNFHSDSIRWEIIILRGMINEFIIFKFHHAHLDGYSLRCLLDKLCGNESHYSVKGWKGGFLYKTKLLIKCTSHIGKIFLTSRLAFYQNLSPRNQELEQVITQDHITKPVSSKLMMSKITVETWKLKEIAKNTKTSFLATVFALHIWSMKKNTNFLNKYSNRGNVCQIITPTAVPGHPVVKTNGKYCCNHFSILVQQFPLDENDPIKLLKKVNSLYKSCADSEFSESLYILQSVLGQIDPYNWIQFATRFLLRQKLFEHMINPFPFWDKDCYVLSRQIKNIYFLATSPYCHENGIMVTPYTRGAEVDISVHARSDIFCSQQEIDNHMNLCWVDGLELFLQETAKSRNTEGKVAKDFLSIEKIRA